MKYYVARFTCGGKWIKRGKHYTTNCIEIYLKRKSIFEIFEIIKSTKRKKHIPSRFLYLKEGE
jgi:hypothetical protein